MTGWKRPVAVMLSGPLLSLLAFVGAFVAQSAQAWTLTTILAITAFVAGPLLFVAGLGWLVVALWRGGGSK